MVARLWRGRARPESADAYEQHVLTTVFPALRRLDGFIGGHVLRRAVGDRVEFLVMTQWTSLNAIRAFAGDQLEQAVVEPTARAMLADFDTHVELFEMVE